MKKKFIIIGSVAFTLFAVATVNLTVGDKGGKISDLKIANIQALSQNENDPKKNDTCCEECVNTYGNPAVKHVCCNGDGGCVTKVCSAGVCDN